MLSYLLKNYNKFIYSEPHSIIMEKKKDGYSSSQTLTFSFSFATLTRTKTTRLHRK